MKDEEEKRVNIRIFQGEDDVIVSFGEPVSWIALPPVDAIRLADHIKSVSEEVLMS